MMDAREFQGQRFGPDGLPSVNRQLIFWFHFSTSTLMGNVEEKRQPQETYFLRRSGDSLEVRHHREDRMKASHQMSPFEISSDDPG
jgi:hypothetical protein